MPCNAAPRPEFSNEDLDALELYMQAQIDRVTQVACDAITILRGNGLFNQLTDQSKGWSREHDAWDAARELLESSAKAVARKPHFDKNGQPLYRGPDEDDIAALKEEYPLGLGTGPDQELVRAVAEDFEAAKKQVGSTASKIKKGKK